MGLDKLTTKFQEALQAAQQLAAKSTHAELKSLHVLISLLQQDGGIVVPILEKSRGGCNPVKGVSTLGNWSANPVSKGRRHNRK